MKVAYSPFWLPWDALVLAVRSFLPLAFFYTAGRVVHDLVLVGAVYAGDVEAPRKFVGFGIMSLAVLATLASYIAMLRVLRRRQGWEPGPDGAGERMGTAIAHTLLPFLVFYGAWGLFTDDVRQYSILAQELFGVQQIHNLEFDPLAATTAIAACAFVVRAVVEKLYERLRKAWLGLLTTAFETMWMFFAVVSVERFISQGADWMKSRALWAGVGDAAGSVLGPVGDAVSFVLPDVWNALVLPLVWVTIAAVVFGRDMGAGEALIEGTRVQPRAGRVRAAAPEPVRKAAEFVSRDLRDKYTPMFNGLRLVLGAGLVFFLVLCLSYTLLTVGRDWAFIGVTALVGPHESAWWTLWHGPVRFGVDLVYEVLRISLLAAALRTAVRATAPAVRNHRASADAPRPAGS
ncbi:hypothetical protein OIE66_08760 [Nonomuraea sp. NBC_01738]|uniref:hypothetical protein n=1 Tax=Nonomuraea sp. NBC_01738 TaxID=2976003 RepID=UPI002E1355E2|nr:hypothetical protein OIE66_08760 [Nonomuraea sp. NBC_01738]